MKLKKPISQLKKNEQTLVAPQTRKKNNQQKFLFEESNLNSLGSYTPKNKSKNGNTKTNRRNNLQARKTGWLFG